MIFCCRPPSSETPRGVPPIIDSAVRCPMCGTIRTEQMPLNACRITYECTGCGEILRPKQGDCCVFCSYGSIPCPPVQAGLLHTLT
jgi:rubredoxin